MIKTDSETIRSMFIEYFKSKGHVYIPGASVLNDKDPSLLFTNAGMNQFKDIFLGLRNINSPRITNSQICLRISGKHNDLNDVGKDTYHHTLFEMLGNWSMNDYFKPEAIQYAWELLTEVYQIPKDILYVTVFQGDQNDNLNEDREAYNIWLKYVNESHIVYGNKHDNFWEMGNTGPCGPCTEIHIDLRSQEDKNKIPGRDLVNKDNPEVIEIWNIVFMQYERLTDGSLKRLGKQYVDTGMGFERLVMVLQNEKSTYDTDIFQPYFLYMHNRWHKRYGEDNKNVDIALRVIVDHIRTITISILDGVTPSNTLAGYVIRRVLRRAVRYGYSSLDIKEPFLYEMVEIVVEQYKSIKNIDLNSINEVKRIIFDEEELFLKTLQNGLQKIEDIINDCKRTNKNIIDGNTVFMLYDTFGFPNDLTRDILLEHNITFDDQQYQKALNEQRERSRKNSQMINKDEEDWIIISSESQSFIGYTTLTTTTTILRYREDSKKDHFQIVLKNSPFYGESGGQVGDIGKIIVDNEGIDVVNTKKLFNMITIITNKLPKNLQGEIVAQVDPLYRQRVSANHSATHLLQATLRNMYGNQLEQKGSFVSADKLRFDFNHNEKISKEDIIKIENTINTKIFENIATFVNENITIEEAKEQGAMAIFVDKYSDKIRMINLCDGFSKELCCGTHVKKSSDIGLFKIISESSIAAGVRRIEAITGWNIMDYIRQIQQEKMDIETMLCSHNVMEEITKILINKEKLNVTIELFNQDEIHRITKTILDNEKSYNDYNVSINTIDPVNDDNIECSILKLVNDADKSLIIIIHDSKKMNYYIGVSKDNQMKITANGIVNHMKTNFHGKGGGNTSYSRFINCNNELQDDNQLISFITNLLSTLK